MKKGKTLFVTGASSEIGCGLIRAVAENYEVILAHYCHNRAVLDAVKDELGEKLVILQADFTDMQDVERMIGKIDALGYVPDHIVHLPSQKAYPQKFHKTELQQYMDGFTTSVASIVLILKHMMPKMSKHKYGKVLFMLTSYTVNAPIKYMAPYVTVKYALLGLMRDLSREYADKGIMVNGVSPDMMETKFISEMPELMVQQYAANSPMGRNLLIGDVIPAFVYLLSEGADMVSGQNICISGGGAR